MEKEHLVRMKDLYGEEGEIIIEQLEKREREYFNLEIIELKKEKADLLLVEDFSKTRST